MVAADSSSYCIGAVILQKQENGEMKPVAYASRALSPTEQRYATIEKEALGITWACERFKDFLSNNTTGSTIFTSPMHSLLQQGLYCWVIFFKMCLFLFLKLSG